MIFHVILYAFSSVKCFYQWLLICNLSKYFILKSLRGAALFERHGALGLIECHMITDAKKRGEERPVTFKPQEILL